jgi:hypothetical protein
MVLMEPWTAIKGEGLLPVVSSFGERFGVSFRIENPNPDG